MWRKEIAEELESRRNAAIAGGGSERISRQHAAGKLTARERIGLLFDEDSFEEIHSLEASAQRRDCLPVDAAAGDGVIVGRGTIGGRPVCAAVEDFTVCGGTLGECHAKKIILVMSVAQKYRLPFIMICDSGGARVEEGVHSLNGYSGIFLQNTKASGKIPQIAAVLGPCAGGACYSPAICDFIFIVRGISKMFVTGPKVVEKVIGRTIDAEELGGAEVHEKQSGVAHFVCEDERACMDGIRRLLTYLPQNCDAPLPAAVPVPPADGVSLQDIVSENRKNAYDVRLVINGIFDGGSFMEIQPEFAKNIVIGFARLDGGPCGVVANQPCRMAGAIDADASDKAARFIRFCDSFGIPLVVLVDTPGFLPGTEQEHKGIIRHGAKLLYAFAEASVMKITLILRKAYGGAYIAMNSKGVGADFVFSWPLAEIAVMGEQGAVEILYRKQIMSARDPDAEREKLAAQYRRDMLSPYICAENGYIDEVIMPEETRRKLIGALSLAGTSGQRADRGRHGNIPL